MEKVGGGLLVGDGCERRGVGSGVEDWGGGVERGEGGCGTRLEGEG